VAILKLLEFYLVYLETTLHFNPHTDSCYFSFEFTIKGYRNQLIESAVVICILTQYLAEET